MANIYANTNKLSKTKSTGLDLPLFSQYFSPQKYTAMFTKQFYVRLFFLLLLCCFSFAAFAQSSRPGYTDYKEGDKSYSARRYEEALTHYKKAIEADPIQYRYYAKKAKAEVQLNRYTDAIASLEKAVELNAGFSGGYVALANLYLKKEKPDPDKAVEYMKLASEKEMDLRKKLNYKIKTVKLLLKLARPEEALTELQSAKEISPKDLDVLFMEGEVYRNMGEWKKALDAYNAALDKATQTISNPGALGKYKMYVAFSYFKTGEEEKYKQIETELCARDQVNCQRLKKMVKGVTNSKTLQLARAYMKAATYEEAQTHIQQAIERKENLPMAYMLEGGVYAKTGEFNQAISSFAKAAELEKDPKRQLKIYATLVKLQFNNKDYSGAITTANRILEANPKNASVLYLKAQAQYNSGDFNGCIASCEKLLETDLDKARKAPYYFTMGQAAKKAGQNDKAKKAFESAQFGVFKLAARTEMHALEAK